MSENETPNDGWAPSPKESGSGTFEGSENQVRISEKLANFQNGFTTILFFASLLGILFGVGMLVEGSVDNSPSTFGRGIVVILVSFGITISTGVSSILLDIMWNIREINAKMTTAKE